MPRFRLLILMLLSMLLVLTACGGEGESVAAQPTATLAPLVSRTPRATATPVVSRTPLPTFTLTPSETPVPPTPTLSLTPTEVPPIIGIVNSLQSVNVRRAPDINSGAFIALDPGTGVVVLGEDPSGRWFNVRLESGEEGWMSVDLVRVEPSPTPFPTLNAGPTADGTAVAQSSPLPTALLGGGTVTPTVPAVTPTPPTTGEPTEESDDSGIPVIDTTAIYATATALAGGDASTATPSPAGTSVGGTPPITTPGATTPIPATAVSTSQAGPGDGGGSGSVQNGTDVLAYCDNPVFGSPPPRNLAAGSSVDVFWGWFARTVPQVRDHMDKAIYSVTLNGEPLHTRATFITDIDLESDGNYHVYYYVRTDELAAGEYTVNYRLTWRESITDGYANFGPGTANSVETGTCTFTVR